MIKQLPQLHLMAAKSQDQVRVAGLPYSIWSRGKKNSRSSIVSKPEATKSLHQVVACYWGTSA